ncbi:MAG TPA: acyl carrier protein [Burkholderiaceae bacterium]|nr:acyl carrier protein [Burkholderiaceae bacterium]
MNAATKSSLAATGPDPRIATILGIVARETKIDPDRLQLNARIDDLGIGSLDLTLVVFEIESHFGIELPFAPEPPTETSMTVGMLIDHVLQALDARANTAASG